MKLPLDHPAWLRWGPVLAGKLVRMLFRSCRAQFHMHPEAEPLMRSRTPVLYAIWHCHLLATLYYFPRYIYTRIPPVLMASPHRDGALVGLVAQRLGYVFCPGSRYKGGFQALKNMTAYLQQGHSAGLAADGSRGPAHVVQKGILYMAREARVPILPLAVASSWKKVFNTWDRFELPLPASRIALLVERPLYIRPADRGAALEQRRLELEADLNRLFSRSQTFFSRR